MMRRFWQMVPRMSAIQPCWRQPFSMIKTVNKQPLYALLTQRSHANFAVHTVNLPNLADSITEGRVQELKKQVGEAVEVDETVAVIETDKVSVEIKAPKAGVITKFHAETGQDLAVGKPFFDIDMDAKASGAAKPQSESKPAKEKEGEKPLTSGDKPAKEAEKPAKYAEKTQYSKPKAEAPKADSSKADKAPAKDDKKKEPTPKPQAPSIFSSGAPGYRKTKTYPLSKLRVKVGQRLKYSQNTYALLTTFQYVDMGEAMEIRKTYQDYFVNKYGIKLGFMSFFVRAAVYALKEYPIVNSVIDGTNMVQRNFIDISVAVATPTGLMVPVLRNCQSLKMHEIELQLAEFAKKGKQGKLTLEDINGGTFTISNGGTFGSLMGTPIINPPQSAILGMHAINNRPVVRGDQIVARPMMYLALTYDHRLLDGKDAVLFLKKIQNCVEDPKRMLLEI